MRFTETGLEGAWVVDLEPRADARGFFARTFDADAFAEHGIPPLVVQANLSFNHRAGTLRGLHFQLPPVSEGKFMRCTQGSIHDVIVDMRPESPTYLQHYGITLSAQNRRALFVPERFAHGYLALEDGAEAAYHVTERYTPGAERGLRFDDPALGIEWPVAVQVVSEKDRSWPLLGEDPDPGR